MSALGLVLGLIAVMSVIGLALLVLGGSDDAGRRY